ncbi:MAG TPA: XrtA/PEP-CTERM system-associated ATPase [Vicinamibacterales bacterium]|nr:XrtA/PEP-CTERM system-associated ATPase [Vicinamibacterales bacterium]
MYERFYNLRERPFALSPDPEYLFLSQVHSEALDSIRYGIESRAGFIVVTGEIGAGKTTLLQTVLQRLDDRTVIARVVNTMLDPRELLDAIALDFGLTNISPSKPVLLRDLGLFLVEQRRQGRRPLLVIDEAQNLSPQALEEVRLLSNLETEKSKLLQILLAGQPNLREKIASVDLEQFRQRIAVSYHLLPLAANETEAYINFRLEHAALGQPLRFPADACSLIHDVTGGVPRLINVLCDAALVFGYAEERRTIDRAMIDEVITELEETGIVRRPVGAGAAAVAPELPPTPTVAPVVATVPAPRPAVATGPTPHVPSTALPAPAPPRLPDMPVPAVAASTLPAERALSAAPSPAVSRASSPLAGIAHEAISDRDRALSAARDAALQSTQLAATREELAGEREALARRQRDLAAKEEALVERERQIAEQRRILGEEYRLLRQSRQATSTASGHTRSTAMRNGPLLQHQAKTVQELTVWQRLFRLFAASHAVRS